jgi:16S rRNA (cytidine1402-2'-O)-methyltransferase
MSILYIVATPIGNLEDISMRALRVLSEVDFILCEDTRVTKRLLDHFKINTPTISYHQHSNLKKTGKILDLLERGKNLALVSDAGTPGISDPGGKLIQAVIKRFGEDVSVESVPGPSAVTAALSVSGIPADKFVFLGFPPHKKGRQKFLRKILESEFTVVVYESRHRIVKFLEELDKASKEIAMAGSGHDRKDKKITNYKSQITNKTQNSKSKKFSIDLQSVVVCRELSKMHETVYRGDIKKIIEKIKNSKDDQKGEFVVIIGR